MLDTVFTLAAADPAAHVYNHVGLQVGPWWVWSGNMGNLIISGLILILGGSWVARHISTGPESEGTDRYLTKSRIAHMIEVICVYLREEICRPMLKDRTDKMMPFLWSLFFFILINNLLGLVPLLDVQHLFARIVLGQESPHWAFIGGTATQNIWVTGVLAIVAAAVFNGAAVARLGVGGYFKHMTGGAPWFVWPLLVPIELLGQVFIKPVALALRLFANMTAGHILLATLFMFAGAVWGRGILLMGPVTLVSVVGGIAVMFLELFVGFLQAFIFMFLTTVFISLMDHHDEHGHDHGHDHATGHEHAHA